MPCNLGLLPFYEGKVATIFKILVKFEQVLHKLKKKIGTVHLKTQYFKLYYAKLNFYFALTKKKRSSGLELAADGAGGMAGAGSRLDRLHNIDHNHNMLDKKPAMPEMTVENQEPNT